MEELLELSIRETVERIRLGEIRPSEAVGAALGQIERWNPTLNALIEVDTTALEQARALDKVSRDRTPPLLGIPVSIKDLILTRDLPTTAGSRVFGSGLSAREDAELVKRLREAGAVVIGKAHLHEFAFGVTNENSHFGPCRNPWDLTRVSGGSSGGSAVSVAAGMCHASVGTDTRGSIRIPSASCGVTGLKPTLSRVPTEGVLPLSWTMDHAGPIARSVEDAALVYEVLAGNTGNLPLPSTAAAPSFRLGICDYYLENLDPDIEKAVLDAIQVLQSQGHAIVPVKMKHLQEAHRISTVIAASEAVTYHETFIRNQPEDYDPSVLARLKKGFAFSAIDLVKALRIRMDVIQEFHQVFEGVDCLVGAALPCRPPRIGEGFVEVGTQRLEIVENLVRLTAPQNVAGVPSLVLPCGFTPDGLPVGFQLIGDTDSEGVLFSIGTAFQHWTDWHRHRPAIAAAANGTG